MRVTTKMMNTNLMGNINSNKNSVYDAQEQYSTGKVIQRPSDDPVIAIRSMKLRTSISEMKQYLDKNIPDAMSWMDISESAMKSMNNVLEYIYTDVVKGANDTLTTEDRKTITESLKQFKKQIYQEGNANYAGRYVFTGYRTDESLTFQKVQENETYEITQKFSSKDITTIDRVENIYTIKDLSGSDIKITEDGVTKGENGEDKGTREIRDLYRIRLGYNDLNIEDQANIKIEYGTETLTVGSGITLRNSHDNNYTMEDDEKVIFFYDTGELIMGKDMCDTISNAQEPISVTYKKNDFKEGDVRPEHYFDCTVTDENNKVTTYKTENQEICYEINFSQNMVVNSQIKNILSIDFGRCIDDMCNVLSEVDVVEDKIHDIDEELKKESLSADEKKTLENLKEQCEIELSLKNKMLTESFEKGMAEIKGFQEDVTIGLADLGSKYARLELIQTRLDSQLTDYTELLSTNEDVDMVEAYINYSSMEAVYNASLSVASKVTKNSLLDFI